MDNATHTLQNVFKLNCFSIPQYQRAYAWEAEPQLNAFLSDLRQQVQAQKVNAEKSYFLGTLLLHQFSDNLVHVVDGQQRLTTSVIFVAAALQKNSVSLVFKNDEKLDRLLKRNFIFDEDEEVQKFKTIEEDNPYFRSKILGLSQESVSEGSPSSYKLKKALIYFLSEVKDDEWECLIGALISAKLMIYSVKSAADATLIFELQNDRGKQLTDLESLKSYLMHLIYLNSKNPEENLQVIQTQFAKIYRQVERHNGNKKIPREDAILSYHCVNTLDWQEDEWRRPKDLIKKTLQGIDKDDVRAWIIQFVDGLHETYKSFTDLFSRLDDYPELAQLIVLDRMATFWPLIIKANKYDNSKVKADFLLVCRLMEVYAMRGYGLSSIRSDAGLSSIYRKARNFYGNFKDLHTFLHSMSYWYDLETRFQSGLDRASLYKSNRRDTQYLLWRYENHMRSQPGKKVGHITWNQYLYPKDDASRLSIEHIAAQNNPVAESVVEWDSGYPKKFNEVATHRLGNLVLDSISANSSKGKYDFTDKLESLSKHSTFLSQGELIDWAIKDDRGDYSWTIDSVKKRHESMKGFVLRTWDPNTYFKPEVEEVIDEEPLENLCIESKS